MKTNSSFGEVDRRHKTCPYLAFPFGGKDNPREGKRRDRKKRRKKKKKEEEKEKEENGRKKKGMKEVKEEVKEREGGRKGKEEVKGWAALGRPVLEEQAERALNNSFSP